LDENHEYGTDDYAGCLHKAFLRGFL